MPSKTDLRRLNDGAKALKLKEPKTKAEIEYQLLIIVNTISRLKSVDDLGSMPLNQPGWNDILTLEKKYLKLKTLLSEYE